MHQQVKGMLVVVAFFANRTQLRSQAIKREETRIRHTRI
jgi:hypothetical protein